MDIRSTDGPEFVNDSEFGGQQHDYGLLHRSSGRLVAILALMLFSASAIRIYHLNSSPILAEVQYRGALIARANYFRMTDPIPDWREEVNSLSVQRLSVKEPPAMEFLVATIYRLLGREDLRVAGLLSATFWVIGGIVLFGIAERVISTSAAIYATAYYLFVPIGIHISVGFLTDPLMIMVFLFSVFTIVRYYEQPTRRRLFTAALVSASAVLLKPLCVFVILGAFTSLAILESTTRKRMVASDLPIFLGICLVPAGMYYLCHILITESLAAQAQKSVLPQLLVQPAYWKGWVLTAADVVGIAPLLAGLVGISLLRQGLPRALLTGLWIGYAVFGLVFSFHIRFAGHYHLQFIIVIALSFGPLVDLTTAHLRKSADRWYWFLPATGALLLVMLFSFREIRSGFELYRRYESRQVAQEIGELVNHSTRTVYVASYYGRPLEYYGELSGASWPRTATDADRALGLARERSVQERLAALDFTPEYFIITDLPEYHRHHADLREFLAHCPLISESEDYLVYEACTD